MVSMKLLNGLLCLIQVHSLCYSNDYLSNLKLSKYPSVVSEELKMQKFCTRTTLVCKKGYDMINHVNNSSVFSFSSDPK